jgi:uncharacterized protein YaiL (DUF2058 family)
MSESLRDQLLKSGLTVSRKPKAGVAPGEGTRPPRKPHGTAQEIDLARAYALRRRAETEAQARERREAEERARQKKERRRRLAELLAGKALNDADADVARHFPCGDRISRIYVTTGQLARLNRGELAVVRQDGRFLLVDRDTALAVRAIDSDALLLLCEPGSTGDDGVPDDLVW